MLVPLIALAMFAQQDKIQPFDLGSALYAQCQETLRVFDNPRDMSTDLRSATSCSAYIDGFVDGLSFGKPLFCAKEASVATMARIYVAYMQKNPKLLDHYKSEGLMLALADAYPCSKK